MAKTAKKKVAKKVAKKLEVKKTTMKVNKEPEEMDEDEEQEDEVKPVKKGKAKTTASGSPEKTYQNIKDFVSLIDEDMDKFLVNETKSAGRRIRGHAQSVRKLCAQFRKEIQALANERKNN